jgi:hypothetical protein
VRDQKRRRKHVEQVGEGHGNTENPRRSMKKFEAVKILNLK